MKTFFLLHRAREPERVFKSAEALVAVALGAGEPLPLQMGHMDMRQRAVDALKATPHEEWLRLDMSTIAQPFEANAKDIDVPVEG